MRKNDFSGLYLHSPKLNQLNILKEVAADAHVTQAELASRCSLSVAMVNNYMKELCQAGVLEYHRKTIKSVTYHLTPSGVHLLETLQLELMNEMVGIFAASKEQVRTRIMSQARPGLQRVILFGCGHLAQLTFHALELAGISILGICSADSDKVGSDFCGREIMSPSQIRFLSPEAVIVSDPPRTEEIHLNLEALSERGIQIIRLDDCSVSIYEESLDKRPPIITGSEAAESNPHLALPGSGHDL